MSQKTIDRHKEALERVAEIYRRRGYRVTVEPPSEQLPDFLGHLRPDILAEGLEESVIVEVKLTANARQAQQWLKIAEVTRQHPGWRFELLAGEDIQRFVADPLTDEEIRQRIREGSDLLRSGHHDAALLIMWSGVEAALRRMAKRHRISVPNDGPGTLIGTLYAEGVLETEQYELLTEIMRVRNRVAHGYRDAEVSGADLGRLEQMSARLVA